MPTLPHSQSSLVSSDEENEQSLDNNDGVKIAAKRRSKPNDTDNESEDEQVEDDESLDEEDKQEVGDDDDESLDEGDDDAVGTRAVVSSTDLAQYTGAKAKKKAVQYTEFLSKDARPYLVKEMDYYKKKFSPVEWDGNDRKAELQKKLQKSIEKQKNTLSVLDVFHEALEETNYLRKYEEVQQALHVQKLQKKADEIDMIKAKNKATKTAAATAHKGAVATLKKQHEHKLAAATRKLETTNVKLKATVETLQKQAKDQNQEIESLKKERDALKKEVERANKKSNELHSKLLDEIENAAKKSKEDKKFEYEAKRDLETHKANLQMSKKDQEYEQKTAYSDFKDDRNKKIAGRANFYSNRMGGGLNFRSGMYSVAPRKRKHKRGSKHKRREHYSSDDDSSLSSSSSEEYRHKKKKGRKRRHYSSDDDSSTSSSSSEEYSRKKKGRKKAKKAKPIDQEAMMQSMMTKMVPHLTQMMNQQASSVATAPTARLKTVPQSEPAPTVASAPTAGLEVPSSVASAPADNGMGDAALLMDFSRQE